MNKIRRSLSIACLFACWLSVPVFAGGQLTTIDVTGFPDLPPGPVPGSLEVGVVPIHQDTRCIPVNYTLNTFALPNSLPVLDVAGTRDVISRAMDSWNAIPTSYIEMRLTGENQHPRDPGPFGFVAFDFVNEVNFLSGASETFGAISPSVSFNADTDATPGLDFDGDGDADFFDPAVEGIETCADVDGDGDIEFPAGFYEAGTMLDNDVSFNNTLVWTTGPPDAVFGNNDLEGVAAHEFGHSHSLSHSALTQQSPTDGTTATMFSGVSSGDPIGQEARRTPASDDRAWSSFVYPEGSASSGPAALQAGDVPFDQIYGVMTGEVTQGAQDLPLAGGSMFAVHRDTGEVASSHYTGQVRLALFQNSVQFLPAEPEFHLVSGSYTLPVPAGEYHVVIEPLDGAPFSASAVSTPAVAGLIYNQLDFNEEYLLKESDGLEFEPLEVEVEAGEVVAGIDHTTSVDVNVDPFDRVGFSSTFDLDGICCGGLPPNTLQVVRFPAAEIQDQLDAGLLPRAAAIRTFLVEASVIEIFARVAFVKGTVNGSAVALDLEHPIFEVEDAIVQDNDYTPFYFKEPDDVAEVIEEAIEDGTSDFFLVIQYPASFAGFQAFPPFVGIDTGQVGGVLGRSYFSVDGGNNFFQLTTWNLMMRLVFGSEP